METKFAEVNGKLEEVVIMTMEEYEFDRNLMKLVGKSLAEVNKIEGDIVSLQVFAGGRGVSTGDHIRFLGHRMEVSFSENLLGRIFNGSAEPRDNGPALAENLVAIGGPYFFRLVVCYAKRALSTIYGMFEFKLPGGVTINYSNLSDQANDEIGEIKEWAEVPFENVGLYKSGDYQITMALSKSLAGFNLLYSLTSNWLVKTDLYDECLNKDQKTSTYDTSVETTCSYGPYKLVSFQSGKALRLEKNENWYGWNDGKHVYVDPTDGQTYPMYQTTAIDCQQIEEASTNKMMFLKGELMGYGLTADDFATYRNSEFCHRTPKETLFFLILNGNKSVLDEREAAADFDATVKDLQTMTLTSFRKAVAVTYDKEL